jgi:hypothetical protein
MNESARDMTTEHIPCTTIQTWLTSADLAQNPPPPLLVDHVAGCARCRGVLLLIVAELLHAPLTVAATTCDHCMDDLAASLDMERDEGIAQAIRAYPHVWWHLWICAECALTYEIVQDTISSGVTG